MNLNKMSYGKNWVFTINNYTLENLNSLIALENHEQVSYIVFQAEQGDAGTPHLQGYVQFATKKRIAGCKRLVGLRAHLEKANGSPSENKRYCTKEEGRLEGPWEFGEVTVPGKRNDLISLRDAVRENPGVSTRDLLDEHCQPIAMYPNYLALLRNVYSEPESVPFLPQREWQNELSITLDSKPDPRKVYWYYDPVGNTGKSFFSRNWRGRDGERGFMVQGGKHADVIYAYGKQQVVFFDFTRDVEERVPYTLMEGFKNGYLFSPKYNSQCLYFNVPHVICFANFEPDQSKLSEDRWEIKNI